MSDKKVNGLPTQLSQVSQQPQTQFHSQSQTPPVQQSIPSGPQAYVPVASHPYGMYPNQNPVYGPPPSYEQAIISPQFYPTMYVPYPHTFAPMPMYQPTYSYPIQAQMRPIYIPNAFDPGARFDGVSQPMIPPPVPGVPPNAAQLAALTNQNVILGQKKASFW